MHSTSLPNTEERGAFAARDPTLRDVYLILNQSLSICRPIGINVQRERERAEKAPKRKWNETSEMPLGSTMSWRHICRCPGKYVFSVKFLVAWAPETHELIQ